MAILKFQATGCKDVGKVRETNQDEFFMRLTQSSDADAVGLFIVADGMGGHAGGDIASSLTVQTISKQLLVLFTPEEPLKTVKLDTRRLEAEIAGKEAPTYVLSDTKIRQMIKQAVLEANKVVIQTAHEKPFEAGDAGSTVTLAVIQGNTAHIANVGDSRTYLYRNGALEQLTEDHSLVASLVKEKYIKPEEIYTHPQRNIIYRSLGNKQKLDVDLFQQTLQSGDRLLLCSDGLWEMVSDSKIAKIMQNGATPDATCKALIRAANQGGGKDNIGVIVVWVE